jgi:hypothetical protein
MKKILRHLSKVRKNKDLLAESNQCPIGFACCDRFILLARIAEAAHGTRGHFIEAAFCSQFFVLSWVQAQSRFLLLLDKL